MRAAVPTLCNISVSTNRANKAQDSWTKAIDLFPLQFTTQNDARFHRRYVEGSVLS